jgi:hypothetical protein
LIIYIPIYLPVVTNRLSVELRTLITNRTDGKDKAKVSAKWISVDFPSMKLPKYKLKPMSSFRFYLLIFG